MSQGGLADIPAQKQRPALLELFVVAAPIVGTMASYTIMHMVDSWMVSRLGPTEIAAQGNGGMIAFVPLSIMFGLLGVINTYVAQNLGANRLENAPRYGWAGIWLSAATWVLLLTLVLPFLPFVFRLMGHAPELRELEVQYGSVMLAGSFFPLAARGLSHFFYGAHRPNIVLIATVSGNLVNVGVNYVLIFGHLGFPQLGVLGAAIGTVIGTMIELAIPLAIFLGPRMHAELNTRAVWMPDAKAIRDVLRIGWPAGLQFGGEIVCWAVFMTVLVGMFGELHNAAGWIALRYMHLSFMPAVGISFALTAIVGRYLGAGDSETAEARAWLGVGLTAAYMGLCGLGFVLFRDPLIGFFIDPEQVTPEEAAALLSIGGKLMICAAVFQVFDGVGITLSGALRGAGDTVWPGVVTAVLSWTCIIGGGYAMIVFFPQLESLGPWIGAALYIILLAIVLLWRFIAGPWRSMKLLEDESPGPAPVDLAAAPEEIAAEGIAIKD